VPTVVANSIHCACNAHCLSRQRTKKLDECECVLNLEEQTRQDKVLYYRVIGRYVIWDRHVAGFVSSTEYETDEEEEEEEEEEEKNKVSTNDDNIRPQKPSVLRVCGLFVYGSRGMFWDMMLDTPTFLILLCDVCVRWHRTRY
jgi:hypothetical protein